jgi:hypothetical protein
MEYREVIADRLHAEGWSYGIAEHLTKHGLLFCVDAHRDGLSEADENNTHCKTLSYNVLSKMLSGVATGLYVPDSVR